jgi:hypothetical protein
MQPNTTIIEIWPYRNGWQCFEAQGVQPFWTGENAKQSAIGYATLGPKAGIFGLSRSVGLEKRRNIALLHKEFTYNLACRTLR